MAQATCEGLRSFRFADGSGRYCNVPAESEQAARARLTGDRTFGFMADWPITDVRDIPVPEWVRRARANALPLRDETNLRGYVL